MASRLTEALLGAKAWQTGNENPALNPALGGQFGYATNPEEWLNAQGYVPRNLIPIVLESPRFFQYMPDRKYWDTIWRLLWEKHARVIEGLRAGLTVETGEHAFGGAGEMFEEIIDVKRERSTLSVTLNDKYGNVFQNFFERMITYGGMDPQTKTPLSVTLEGGGPSDNLADQYTGSVGFIQPDPTGKRCERMWISVNVFPKGTGSIEGRMDKTTALTVKELTLEFTSLTFINEGTRVYGQQLLDAINMTHANPQARRSPIESIDPNVEATDKGYRESVENIAARRVDGVI